MRYARCLFWGSLFVAGTVLAADQPEKASAPISRSFEVRHISSDPAANGESDFLGPTSVLSTDQRIEFLRALAATAGRFFIRPATSKIGEAVVLDIDRSGRMTADGRQLATLAKGAWSDLRIEVAIDTAARSFNVDVNGSRCLSAGQVGEAAKVDQSEKSSGPLPWGSGGHDESKNPVNNHKCRE